MKNLYTLGIIAGMLAMGSMAMAYPTLNGETGIVALPNALTAGNGSFVGAADLLFTNDNSLKVRALYGLSSQAEIGASLSSGDDNGISISAKYRFTSGPSRFNLAAGGALTAANHQDTAIDLYLVGTEAFPLGGQSSRPLLGTFGVHFVNIGSDNTLRPFIGAQYPIGPRSELGAEFQLRDGNFFHSPLTSVVLRHKFTSAWAGQVGVTNATGYGTTSGYHPFLGAQFTFTQKH